MSAAKTSPAPWSIGATDYTRKIIAADGVTVASSSWHSHLRKPYPLQDEAVANIQLAATAPELLRDLTDAEEFLQGFEDDVAQKGVDQLLRRIRATIAKATGAAA